ncbi:MAG TPA: hypothetical protein VKB93_22740 [Thermoanaerobaculia bacterium]|nr:hypothetical protein [Thermoanaerobaculia bacterium]
MRLLRLAVSVVLIAMASVARAGSGTIGDGRIDITLNFRFPPTEPQLTTTKNRITAMSHLLFDATEGQLRIGTVTIGCSNIDSDLADFWIYAEPIRSGSPVGQLAVLGAHINQHFGEDGGVWAHEFGHLGLGLSDEYTHDQTSCGAFGWCIEENPPAFDEVNQCLMQQTPGLTWSEFCVADNHDDLRGDNTDCLVAPAPGGAPCAENCESWHTTNLQYENARQQPNCWQALADSFGLTIPDGLPDEAEPAGWCRRSFL